MSEIPLHVWYDLVYYKERRSMEQGGMKHGI